MQIRHHELTQFVLGQIRACALTRFLFIRNAHVTVILLQLYSIIHVFLLNFNAVRFHRVTICQCVLSCALVTEICFAQRQTATNNEPKNLSLASPLAYLLLTLPIQQSTLV